MALQPNYRDILVAFGDHAVEYLVVGGYAVGFHGQPRFTKDPDLWIRPTPENLRRVRAALVAFGAPEGLLLELDHAAVEDVLWMGSPPVRIDIVKGVPSGDFERAYGRRVTADWDGVQVDVVGRAERTGIPKRDSRL